MGYRLNRLDEPVFMAVSKPLRTEFGIHHRLKSCVKLLFIRFYAHTHKMDNTEVKGHEKTVPEGTESCVDFSLRPLLLMERFYSGVSTINLKTFVP